VQVVKRDCSLVDFDRTKIYNAIMKAMKNGSGIVKSDVAEQIAEEIEAECREKADDVNISTIESRVFLKLIEKDQGLTAKAYEGYRKVREFQRENDNTTDSEISELLRGDSEYWNTENSNKNAKLITWPELLAKISQEGIYYLQKSYKLTKRGLFIFMIQIILDKMH